MKKILLINCDAEYAEVIASNKGTEAVVISTIEILRQFMPDARFTTFMQCPEELLVRFPDLKVVKDKYFAPKRRFSLYTSLKSTLNLLRCMTWAALRRYLNIKLTVLINNNKLKQYADADVIIHLGTDNYSEDADTQAVIEHSQEILLGILLGKPVVVWAESVGPFRSKLGRWLAKFTLNKVSLITLREEISKNLVQDLGVNKPPLYVTAEPAFLLDPSPPDTTNEILRKEGINPSHKPLVGVNFSIDNLLRGAAEKASPLMSFAMLGYHVLGYVLPDRLHKIMVSIVSKTYKPQERFLYPIYIRRMVQIIDHLTEKLDATVILIPHVEQGEGELVSDKLFYKDIESQAKNKEKVQKIAAGYTPEEMKGIIGKCDLFIGQKMHANIAALSQGIPTIALAISHKFYGIMRMLGQEQYTVGELKAQEVIAAVDHIWSRKNQVRSELKSSLELVRQSALLNGKLVKELFQIE